MFSVYMHKCPNGKVYIGITTQECEKRWKNGKGYSNNKHFSDAIKKYGWDNIEHLVLHKNLTKDEACKYEKKYIERYDSTNREKGYNKSVGGDCSALGFRHTEESKEKIGKAAKGKKLSKENIEKLRQGKIKAVDVYDIYLNYIKTCDSAVDAEKLTGVDNANIIATCKGKYSQMQGYIFRYAGEKAEIEHKHRKPVKMFDLEGNFIKMFPTIKSAAKEMNIKDTHISDCCKGRYKQSGGYVWKYA